MTSFEAMKHFTPPIFNLLKKCSFFGRVVAIGMTYSTLSWIVPIICIVGLTCWYWVEKYELLRRRLVIPKHGLDLAFFAVAIICLIPMMIFLSNTLFMKWFIFGLRFQLTWDTYLILDMILFIIELLISLWVVYCGREVFSLFNQIGKPAKDTKYEEVSPNFDERYGDRLYRNAHDAERPGGINTDNLK
eukprot:TRINITY_DN23717_c0_g2_i2.p1 TRINITY_DN23717_c0_g2~~TRINITY_DN23717_c0_g2_i2.p1  ORF type:complete len:189 (+),score=20.98 TRINITY_DN23717_c0_g2_i2:155-721(+)